MPDDSACQHSLPPNSKSHTRMLKRHQLLSSQWVTTCATRIFCKTNDVQADKQQRFERNHGTCIVNKGCTMSEHAADSGGNLTWDQRVSQMSATDTQSELDLQLVYMLQ